jgi:hypothetical protein
MNLSPELAQRYPKAKSETHSGNIICGKTNRRCPNHDGIHSEVNINTGTIEIVAMIGQRYPGCAGCPEETGIISY